MGDLLPSRRIQLLTVLSSMAAAQVSIAATITQFPTLPVQNSSFAIEDLDGDGKFDIILISATPNTGGVPVICEVIGGDGDALAAAAGAGDALDVAAGDSGLDFALVHRADDPVQARHPLGGAPNVIVPICTFSAPAMPCTTPPLMLN